MTLATRAAVAALEARVTGAPPDGLEIVTDTRAVTLGKTFLALKGERFDGHAFVGEAFARGAAAAVVADDSVVPDGRAALVVPDTLQAYLQLATLARNKIAGKVVAISGSAGKTTTKAFLLQLLLAAAIPAVATPENENNEIGVAKFLLGLDESDRRVAIVEMGARKYRDLDVLVAAAQPEVAILTNVGDAHLEIFGSRARLADTKWGLFAGGARAILNAADDVARDRAGRLSLPPLWFGTNDDAPPLGEPAAILRPGVLRVDDGTARTDYPVDVHVPGEHNRRNLAAAFAAAIALGYAPEALAPHAGAVTMPPGRYQRVAARGVTVIFDAYNASMSGTLATLATFGGEAAARRIAVLGSMAELGEESAAMHRRVGAAAAAVADVLLAGGDYGADLAQGALDAGAAPERVVRYADNAAAAAWLAANGRPGDAVLLKGSRKYKMEQIAAALGAEAFA